MKYKVDFNYIRELQLVKIRGDNFLNFIKASVLLIKFFSKLFYI